jgi:AcrR family transcriptional regulator
MAGIWRKRNVRIMARTKEFDRDEALQAAIGVFCEKGYAAASTDELMRAMKISRQSMYDTFGDKRQLYLEAFQRYVADSINEEIGYLAKSSSPLAGIEKMLLAFATRTAEGKAPDGRLEAGDHRAAVHHVPESDWVVGDGKGLTLAQYGDLLRLPPELRLARQHHRGQPVPRQLQSPRRIGGRRRVWIVGGNFVRIASAHREVVRGSDIGSAA